MTKALLQQGQLPDEFQTQLAAFFTTTSAGRARPGLLPMPNLTGRITATSTSSASVDLDAFYAVIPGTGTTPGCFLYGQGPDTLDILTEKPAGSMPRIDVIAVQVTTHATTGTDTADVVVLRGSPAATPIQPSLPANTYKIGHVTIPAEAKTITTAMISNTWQLTQLRGGHLIVQDTANRNQVNTTELIPGQRCWLINEARVDVWSGTRWITSDTGWKKLPIYSNWVPYRAGGFLGPEYRVRDGIAHFRGLISPDFIKSGTWSGGSSGNDFLTVPGDARQAGIPNGGGLLYNTLVGIPKPGTTTVTNTHARVLYRVELDGAHRLWLQDESGGYAMTNSSWISLSGLSWPVG